MTLASLQAVEFFEQRKTISTFLRDALNNDNSGPFHALKDIYHDHRPPFQHAS